MCYETCVLGYEPIRDAKISYTVGIPSLFSDKNCRGSDEGPGLSDQKRFSMVINDL